MYIHIIIININNKYSDKEIKKEKIIKKKTKLTNKQMFALLINNS